MNNNTGYFGDCENSKDIQSRECNIMETIIYSDKNIEITRSFNEFQEYQLDTWIDGKKASGLTFLVDPRAPVSDEYVVNIILSQLDKAR